MDAQQEYHFELEGNARYRAVLEDPALRRTPGKLAYHIYNGGGQRLGRPVLPPEVTEVEIYLLCWVVNWDVKLWKPGVKQA